MAEARDSHERILNLGNEELALIGARDTERLGSVLRERGKAIEDFLASDDAHRDEAFLEKLLSIQAMNTRLHYEAKALHQTLKDELLKLRAENRRLSGYRNGGTITPLGRRVLSRKG